MVGWVVDKSAGALHHHSHPVQANEHKLSVAPLRVSERGQPLAEMRSSMPVGSLGLSVHLILSVASS